MPKPLKILFVVSLLLAGVSVAYYYYAETRIKKNTENKTDVVLEMSDVSSLENGRLFLNSYSEIQALFLKTNKGLLYYKDRQDTDTTEKSLPVDNPVLYICHGADKDNFVSLDKNNPGTMILVDPSQFNTLLQNGQPILIVTIKVEQDTIKVNYLVSNTCE